jgi:nucleosome binding factor SPN SPT16 subunit
VDPKPEQKAQYMAVCEAQGAAIAALTDGAKMSAAYEAAVSVLKTKGEERLLAKMPKNVGHAIGLELRDNTNALSASNDKVVKAGMTFNVSLGKSTDNMHNVHFSSWLHRGPAYSID